MHDRLGGTVPTIASALEIMVRPDLRGAGRSAVMLRAMRDNVAKLGFRDLIAPVRPTSRSGPIREYAFSTRPDGLPVDVPSASAPVHVSRADDVASYVEPNVWVHHRL